MSAIKDFLANNNLLPNEISDFDITEINLSKEEYLKLKELIRNSKS